MEQGKLAYLDNAATTKVCEEAVEAAVNQMRVCYGNPSSLHGMGAASMRMLTQSREAVAKLLGCESESIYFTSGGSESNNLAIFGAAFARARRGKHIVTTAAEHSSVLAACRRLEEMGWSVTYVKPDRDGSIDLEEVDAAVTDETTLVSIMMVNNETGAIFPVEAVARMIHSAHPDTLIHCDGVQAFGKLPLRIGRTGIDMMSMSGHKICAPKGSGALYVRRGLRILPLIYGGGQEHGLRSGTENLPAITAFGAACECLTGRIKARYDRAAALREEFMHELAEIPCVCINSPSIASPYILNLSVLGYRSEPMLHFLESKGVYVSSGSACSKGAKSEVLSAMGLSAPVIDSALRVSLIYDTTEAELDRFIEALREGIASLAH